MNIILDSKELLKIIDQMAESICESWNQASQESGIKLDLALVGIRSRGGPLADRLAEIITAKSGRQVKKGLLDITLYRDDLSKQKGLAIVKSTDITFPLEGMLVFIVDDVLYTGRTIRAALDALFDLGRPHLIKLAVLVDRGGRELPIQADVVGISHAVKLSEKINVHVKEIDGKDEVVVQS